MLRVPTTLSPENNKEFRRLYLKYYGVELTVDEANDEAFRIMSMMAIIIDNTPKYHLDNPRFNDSSEIPSQDL